MAIFYLPQLQEQDKEIVLSEEESKHCIRVLRFKVGDALSIVNGQGLTAEATISDANPKKCKANIHSCVVHPKTQDIHIAVCPTKNADRLEWLIEKAVELGLTRITFLHSKNNERTNLKLERIEKIAIAAMKQSKRFFLPEIIPMMHIDKFTAEFPGGYIAHCYEAEKHLAVNGLKNGPVIIGPEGDFTQEEVDIAMRNGYTALDLGPFRLRTETAALAVVLHLQK